MFKHNTMKLERLRVKTAASQLHIPLGIICIKAFLTLHNDVILKKKTDKDEVRRERE